MNNEKRMGRPRKGDNLRVLLTTRVDAHLSDEIKGIAEALYGNISAVMEDLIKLGLEEFKRKNPALMKAVYERQSHSHEHKKRAV